jgi:hypothetical protein
MAVITANFEVVFYTNFIQIQIKNINVSVIKTICIIFISSHETRNKISHCGKPSTTQTRIVYLMLGLKN